MVAVITTTTAMTLQQKKLVSIAISSDGLNKSIANLNIFQGDSQQLKVIGTYVDKSTKDITRLAKWKNTESINSKHKTKRTY